MKKINALLKNENVLATVIVAGVFVLTAAITIYALYKG